MANDGHNTLTGYWDENVDVIMESSYVKCRHEEDLSTWPKQGVVKDLIPIGSNAMISGGADTKAQKAFSGWAPAEFKLTVQLMT